jgi:Predicted nucleic acid-binding protein, contains PIN domain
VQEEFSERAREIRVTWGRSRVARYAPALVDYEIVSTLNQKQLRGSLTADEADAVLELALEEPLNIIRTQDAHRDALRLARRFGLRSTYDAHYLALADDLDCEFWTADERLYNAVRERFPLIRWLGAA